MVGGRSGNIASSRPFNDINQTRLYHLHVPPRQMRKRRQLKMTAVCSWPGQVYREPDVIYLAWKIRSTYPVLSCSGGVLRDPSHLRRRVHTVVCVFQSNHRCQREVVGGVKVYHATDQRGREKDNCHPQGWRQRTAQVTAAALSGVDYSLLDQRGSGVA